MSTKKRILDAALTLFSENGYTNVFVAQIAEAVGIKAPSLYKHYKSKRDIFNAILDEMKAGYDRQAAALSMDGNDSAADAMTFAAASEDGLVQMGMSLFNFFLHDEYTRKFRKMLTLEQFHNPELAQLFSRQYIDDSLKYQSAMFAMLCQAGMLKDGDPYTMALQFHAPIYTLLTMCDRQPEREEELTALLERHIRQFRKMYSREEE
ncbi:MAG: TetR/AcrR family transcriptional regulator [Ruminococcaceae bacterium]|nr:TetR/AcrR family transcriptional regulator [Oscillospiraceae bacterium]